jgi:hypothetical protein
MIIPPFEKQVAIAECIDEDKDALFSMADQVLAAAPVEQWPVWVGDATSSYYPLTFLKTAYDLTDHVPRLISPTIVDIANSRNVQANTLHAMAVERRLAQPDLGIAGNNVLLVSDYADKGASIATLAMAIRSAGAHSVHAAIVSNDSEALRIHTGEAGLPDRLYEGRRDAGELRLYSSHIMRRSLGRLSTVGIAEAHDDPNANHGLREYIVEAYKQLAMRYTRSRAR